MVSRYDHKNDDEGGQGPAPPDLDRLLETARKEARTLKPAGAAGGGASSGAVASSCPLPDSIPGYRIQREIHRGGQGVVYQAIQESTRRTVAVKVLTEGPFASERDKSRFEREVQILARIDHPGVVTVQDTGAVAGCHYFVMDYIAGQPLDVWAASKKRDPREIVRAVASVCDAVQAAHRNGILHRDLKPANVRVDPEGRPHVLDFGLAKVTGVLEASELTVSGQFVGSLPWASPEQVSGNGLVDLRTDVYAIGVLLYQLLTGRFPYDVAGNVRDVIDGILEKHPPAPSRLDRRVDDELSTIVLKCLRKDPSARYQTAGEIERDLGRWLRGEPVEAKADSPLYLLRKTVARFWIPVVLTLAFLVVVTTGLVVSVGLWREAERAGEEATVARHAAENESARLERSLYFNRMLLAQHALEDDDIARVKSLLEDCPESLRGWEWRRLAWLSDRSRSVLTGHEKTVLSVVFSPDGSLLASGGADGLVLLWHVPSGARLFTLRGHEGSVESLAFSPDGNSLVTGGSDGTVRVWDPHQGVEVAMLSSGGGPVEAVVFAATSGVLACAWEDGTFEITEPSGSGVSVRGKASGGILSLAFADRGNLLLCGGADGRIGVFDAADGHLLRRLSGHASGVNALAVSDRGLVASGGIDGRLQVTRLDSGDVVFSRELHGSWVYGVAIDDARGHALSSGADHTLKITSLATGELLRTLRGHEGRVFACAISPDGRLLASGSEDTTVRLWEAEGGQDSRVIADVGTQIWSVAADPTGGRIAMAAGDGTVTLRTLDDGDDVLLFPGHRGAATFVTFSPSAKILASAGMDGTIRLGDVESGSELRVLAGHTGMIPGISFSPPGDRLVSCGRDRTLRVWDPGTGTELACWKGDAGPYLACAFSPDGTRIAASTTNGTVEMREATTGDVLFRTRDHGGSVFSLVFLPDGDLVSASIDTTVHLLDGRTGAVKRILEGHRNGVRCVAVSPDGERIVAGGWDATLRVWDRETGSLALVLRGHGKRIDGVAFSADGRRIVSASLDGTVRLWDALE